MHVHNWCVPLSLPPTRENEIFLSFFRCIFKFLMMEGNIWIFFVGTTKLITIRSRLLFFVFLWTTWLYLLAITLAYSNGLKEFYYYYYFLFVSLQYVVDVLHIKRRWDFDDLLRRNFFRKQTEEFFCILQGGRYWGGDQQHTKYSSIRFVDIRFQIVSVTFHISLVHAATTTKKKV